MNMRQNLILLVLLSFLTFWDSSICNSDMNPSSENLSFLDAIQTGFLETQNHLQNLYCVYGNGDLGDLDDGNSGGVKVSGEMMLPYDQMVMSNATAQSVSVMKQEMCWL